MSVRPNLLPPGEAFQASGLPASQGSRQQAPQAIKAAAAGPAGLGGILLIGSSDPADLFAPVEIAQACTASVADAEGSIPAKIWFATVGGQLVEDRTAASTLRKAALWGAGRMLAEEHPDRWGSLVDLDPLADAHRNARHLVRAMPVDEDQIAFRDDSVFALRLMPLGEAAGMTVDAPWRTDGAYLITGGLGAVGLHVAAAMVDARRTAAGADGPQHASPRSEWSSIPPDTAVGRRVASVRALEAAGATIHLLQR